jgi:hypothetical protein
MKHIQTTTKSESPLCKSPAVRRIAEKMSNHARYEGSNFRRYSCEILLRMGIIGLAICAANAWAGPASIQGVVKDAKGQPIKGADVRVESRDGKQLFNTVKTDAKGRYISQGLQPGVYRVALIVNGATKASITNTTTKSDQTTQLNFDLKPVATGQTSTGQKKAKHMVWVPPSTGTHTGGRWVEVPDGAAEPGTLNVKKVSAEELQRAAQTMSQKPSGQ